MERLWLFAPTLLACALLIAALSQRSPRAAIALCFATQLSPLIVPAEQVLARALCTLAALVLLMRGISVATDPTPRPFRERLFMAMVLFDVRGVRPAQPSSPLPALLSGVLFILLSVAGLQLVFALPNPAGAQWLLRWLGGVLFIYGAADAANSLLTASGALLGQRLPPQHNHPALARSVSDFWSRRWNINVHAWLRQACYVPFARAGRPRMGIAAAFVASALIHAWLAWLPLNLEMAGWMLGFFLLQGVLLLVERHFTLHRWPRALQHGWAITAVLLPSPLFIEPMLRIVA